MSTLNARKADIMRLAEKHGDKAKNGKILHIIPTIAQGGAEKVLSDVVSNVPGKHIIVVMETKPDFYKIPDSVPIYRLGIGDRTGIWQKIKGIAKLAFVLSWERPAVVVGWSHVGHLAASVLRRVARVRAVWSLHASATQENTPSGKNRLQGYVDLSKEGSVDAIHYVSDLSRKDMMALGVADGIVARHMIDLGRFSVSKTRSTKSFVFVNAARIDPPVKDHETLLKAFAIVKASKPDAHLVCVGRGTDGIEFRELMRKHGGDGVTGLGEILEVERVYAAANAFVLSSAVENSPIVIAEALASGLPIASTNVGDVEEVIGNLGRLAPPRDPVALAAAMCSVYMDKDLQKRVLIDGPGRIAKLYDGNSIRDAWSKILASDTAKAPTILGLMIFWGHTIWRMSAIGLPTKRSMAAAGVRFGISFAILTFTNFLPWGMVRSTITFAGNMFFYIAIYSVFAGMEGAFTNGIVDRISAVKKIVNPLVAREVPRAQDQT